MIRNEYLTLFCVQNVENDDLQNFYIFKIALPLKKVHR